jgi:hypothetical protein
MNPRQAFGGELRNATLSRTRDPDRDVASPSPLDARQAGHRY